MAKEKVNYQEVYDLYQLCSEIKDLREFCADYGVNYDKFMNWQRHPDDGKIAMQVKKVLEDRIVCKVLVGGELGSRKSINIPDYNIDNIACNVPSRMAGLKPVAL